MKLIDKLLGKLERTYKKNVRTITLLQSNCTFVFYRKCGRDRLCYTHSKRKKNFCSKQTTISIEIVGTGRADEWITEWQWNSFDFWGKFSDWFLLIGYGGRYKSCWIFRKCVLTTTKIIMFYYLHFRNKWPEINYSEMSCT